MYIIDKPEDFYGIIKEADSRQTVDVQAPTSDAQNASVFFASENSIVQKSGSVNATEPELSSDKKYTYVNYGDFMSSLGGNGQNAILNISYDGRNVEALQKAISAYYDLGLSGMEFDRADKEIKNFEYGGVLTELEARRIHQAGMRDGARKRSGGLVADEIVRERIGNKTAESLNEIGKKLNVTIEFVENMGDIEGLYKNGKKNIYLKASEPYVGVFSHEVTHYIKEAVDAKTYKLRLLH